MVICIILSFNALMLLVGQQEGHNNYKNSLLLEISLTLVTPGNGTLEQKTENMSDLPLLIIK